MAQFKFQSHHGMVDILPEESYKWVYLENIIRETATEFGFSEIRTPVLEQTELIARGIGALTDIVSKEMFTFERGDNNYVLRPECTAPVARAFIQHHLDQRGGVQKLFYIGPMFRAERPQKGRQRQFHQFGAELIGSDQPIADVEIIRFMMRIYEKIGLKNIFLQINSVGNPESRATYKQALQDYFRPLASELSEISKDRLENNPMRILDSKEPEDKVLIEGAPRISEYLSLECREHYESVKSHLRELNIKFIENPLLVRGLDYYTRTAFELTSPDLGSQDALGGGGRYDLLIEEIGGKPTPAVGFASGMERVLIASEALNLSLGTPKTPDVYIITRGDEAQKWAIKTADTLRLLGVSVTMEYSGRSIKAQMKDANRQSATYALIVGDSELESGLFTLRNMAESTENSLTYDAVIKQLSQ